MIIDFMLMAAGLYLICFVVAGIDSVRKLHRVEVQCTCGASVRVVDIIDPIDAKRLARLLTEGCVCCRNGGRIDIYAQRGGPSL